MRASFGAWYAAFQGRPALPGPVDELALVLTNGAAFRWLARRRELHPALLADEIDHVAELLVISAR
jgi:hypothetical protein